MPEGPEIRRQTDLLIRLIGNKKFLGIHPYENCKYIYHEDIFSDAIDYPLKKITCKGKWFFIQFEGFWITAHHGMGGHWTDQKKKGDNNYHLKLYFGDVEKIGDKSKIRNLTKIYLNNTRFGKFEILTNEEVKEKMDGIAGGFIGDYILSLKEWINSLAKFTDRKMLHGIWLDGGKVCSGIGNYLRSEIMYEAGLHPATKLGDMNEQDRIRLYQIAKKVTERFYNGPKEWKVYGQPIDPEGRKVVKYKKSSRHIWFVEEKQKEPLWLIEKRQEALKRNTEFKW